MSRRPLKIGYISTDFGVPIYGYKGASIHVREMVGAFVKAGHQVSVLSPAIDLTTVSDEGATYLPVPADKRHLDLFEEFRKLDKLWGSKSRTREEVRNMLYNLTLYDQGLALLSDQNIDFIYERYTLFAYAGIKLARQLGVPHLLEVNAPLAYEQEKMRGLEMKTLARKMETEIFRQTDKAIVVSNHLKNFLKTQGVPGQRIDVLPNSVDPARFTPGQDGLDLRSQLGLGSKCVIGFVGSLKPWHGTETLLEAFHSLQAREKNIHLLLVGDGPCRSQLEELVQIYHLHDAVTFAGKVSYPEIPKYIDAMDIAVAPYIPNENFYYSPIKIFEYMAMGKPTVAGRIGQVGEIIKDGETGLLYEPGRIAELTEVLKKMVCNPVAREEIGKQARQWVMRERTWDQNARHVTDLGSALKLQGQTAGSE